MFRKVGFKLRAFASDRAGVAAIEFSVLAIPFITGICMVLQTLVVHYYTNCLDGAVRNFVAEVRSGQFVLKTQAGANITVDDIRSRLALNLPVGMSASLLEIELFAASTCVTNGACWASMYSDPNKAIRKVPSFSATARNTSMSGAQSFKIGGAGQSQYLAAYYPIPSITSFLNGAPTAVVGGSKAYGIITTAMWINDPSVQP